MKKFIILFLVSIFFLTGCETSASNIQKEKYIKYINELKNIKKSSKDIPFDIEVKYDKLTDDEIRYQVIIDNVKENIYDIEALAVHNKDTDDIFPSIGIFDEKPNLLKDKKPSGVILVGYIDYQGEVKDFGCKLKVIVKYKTSDKKNHIVYYVTKK